VDHSADTLVLRAGAEDIQNVKAYVGGSVIAYNNTQFLAGSTIILKASNPATGNFSGDVSVTIEYQSVSSGLAHNVTATLHGA
jgi:hypothetical protein